MVHMLGKGHGLPGLKALLLKLLPAFSLNDKHLLSPGHLCLEPAHSLRKSHLKHLLISLRQLLTDGDPAVSQSPV